MEYILGMTILLLTLALVLMAFMMRRIVEQARDYNKMFDQQEKYIKELLNKNEQLVKEIEVPPVAKEKTKVELLLEELMKKSDEDEVQSLIDLRKAWNWNGQKGDVNE